MKHRATRRFWKAYADLPEDVQERARQAYALLRADPRHPSLHFKKTGPFWSARVDIDHRALGYRTNDGFIWVWIGLHDEYMRLIRSS